MRSNEWQDFCHNLPQGWSAFVRSCAELSPNTDLANRYLTENYEVKGECPPELESLRSLHFTTISRASIRTIRLRMLVGNTALVLLSFVIVSINIPSRI